MVFHMAPPHPASKARMICSPVLVGGPDASQKGLGEWMDPAKPRTRRSGPVSGMDGLRMGEHGQRGALSIRHRVYHFAATVHAIAPGVVARIAGATGRGIGDQAAVANLQVAELF